tara:strand:+ start:1655 stop:2470 length:816 start_codon:yes stop_codon:yes gene_type:complete
LNLEDEIINKFKNSDGEFAIAYKDLSSDNQILYNEKVNFHAASTMKTPLMIEVFNQINEDKFNLYDSILIINQFKSIVDDSFFSLSDIEDSEKDLYEHLGKKKSIYSLVFDMITVSSNFATNLIIDYVGAENVNNTMRKIGANDINVLRGVEDIKAFEKGLNNTTTAYDLMIIFEKLAEGEIIDKFSSEKMIEILLNQKYKDKIGLYLPKNIRIASKDGIISSAVHDSGIVFLPDGRKYILVILSKNLNDVENASKLIAEVSKLIYEHSYQ